MILARIGCTVGAAAALSVLTLTSAPAASADVPIRGASGDDCILIINPYVTVTPNITAGAGEVHFYGVSECD